MNFSMIKVLNLHISKWEIILLVGDIIFYSLSLIIALYLNPKLYTFNLFYLRDNFHFYIIIALCCFTIFYIFDLYDYHQNFSEILLISKLIILVALGTAVSVLIFYFSSKIFIARVQLVLQGGIFAGLLVLWRWGYSKLILSQRIRKKVLIIGAGKCGRSVLAAIRQKPTEGLEPVGFIDDDPQKIGAIIDGLKVVGDSSNIADLITQHNLRLVIVAIPHYKSPLLLKTLTKICWNGCKLIDAPEFLEFLEGKIPIEHISDFWLYLYSKQASKIYYLHFKRLMDLILSTIGLLITWPLFIIIALVIKMDSDGPVFFIQERLGQDNQPFKIIKFRTMIRDAEKCGPQFATANDPRITRVGRILRKSRLDELPQLLNILKGEMSFIGPRPERPEFIKEFQQLVPDLRTGQQATKTDGDQALHRYKEKIPFYSYRLLVKPGITGWAQVMYQYASSLEQTYEKLQYDLFYIKNICFFLDVAILLKTVRIILFGRGK